MLCITNADSWNTAVKDKYITDLLALPQFRDVFLDARKNVFFAGVPEVKDVEDDDIPRVKEKEDRIRASLFTRLKPANSVLDELLVKWRSTEINELRIQLAEARQMHGGWCSLL